MARIVTYVHRYKRPPRKKPEGPSIETPVVQAKAPGAKAKGEQRMLPASRIVTSISRHDAQRKRAWDQVQARDDDGVSEETDAVLSARYRKYIEAALGTKKPKRKTPQRKKLS